MDLLWFAISLFLVVFCNHFNVGFFRSFEPHRMTQEYCSSQGMLGTAFCRTILGRFPGCLNTGYWSLSWVAILGDHWWILCFQLFFKVLIVISLFFDLNSQNLLKTSKLKLIFVGYFADNVLKVVVKPSHWWELVNDPIKIILRSSNRVELALNFKFGE